MTSKPIATAFGLSLFVVLALAGGAPAAGGTSRVLYRFHGGSDGDSPLSSMLADKAGNLYGTTFSGGGGANCSPGCGTVFELSPPSSPAGAWTERVLYSFKGGDDGAGPETPLVADRSGNLYGATTQGGIGNCNNEELAGCGTIFELTRPAAPGGAWTESVLYSFQGVPGGQGNGDAAWPNAVVFGPDGSLYGTAYDGGHCFTDETGTSCYGGAFVLKKPPAPGGAWSERVLYRFSGPSGGPASAVLDKAGNLYGTAQWGAYGFGFVFELSPPQTRDGAWTESSLYDFQGSGDGAFPLPGLAFDATGDLYGASLGPGYGYSNIFELSPSQGGGWTESVLYNFSVIRDGYLPATGPILGRNGHLYGTTEEGGRLDRGAVLELAPPGGRDDGWTERVLSSFAGGSDGFAPYGGLNFGKGGLLYGTTAAGGDLSCGNGNGCGTVFAVVP